MTCGDNSSFISVCSNYSGNLSSFQQNISSTLRPMKRLWKKNDDEYDLSMRISNLEPLRKRALYEEKMSNTLQNLNIGLTENTIVPENSSSIFTDDWGLSNADSQVEAKIDSVSDILDIQNEKISDSSISSQIILTDPLKLYIEKCKKENDLKFLKYPKRTGKELILYQPLSLPDSNSKIPCKKSLKFEENLPDDIRNRIRELNPEESELFEKGFLDLNEMFAEDSFISPDEMNEYCVSFPEEEEDVANLSDGSFTTIDSAGSQKSVRAILSASRNLSSQKHPSRTSTPSNIESTSSGLLPASGSFVPSVAEQLSTSKFSLANSMEQDSVMLMETD